MTELLENVIAQLKLLPVIDQDVIAGKYMMQNAGVGALLKLAIGNRTC
jgi:hypothetical protein